MTQATRAELACALKHAIEIMNENSASATISLFLPEDASLHDELKVIGKSLKDEAERLEKILSPPDEE